MSDQDKPIVVVTGAGSRDGRSLTAALSDSCRVIGMDRRGTRLDVPFIPVDLAIDASVDQAISALRDAHGGHLAGVVHLAEALSPHQRPDGTRRLLKQLGRLKVDRFVLASSMFVVGSGDAIGEGVPTDPADEDARAHLAAEQVVQGEAGAIPSVILRLARLYDDEVVDGALAHQIAAIRERNVASHVHEGGTGTRQPVLHRDDLAAAVRLIVAKRTSIPRELVLMLGEPNPPSYRTLQDRIGEALHGERWRTLPVPGPVAGMRSWLRDRLQPHLPAALGGGDHPTYPPAAENAGDHVVDIGRGHALLGWRPRRRLTATLPTILRWLKRDPRSWYEKNSVEWQEPEEER